MRDILEKIQLERELEEAELLLAMETILGGRADPLEISAFLMAMRVKGESTRELAAIARSLRSASITVDISDEHAVDLCGTGGDGADTFNISTTAMFIAAGAGVPVLKHGNRSVSSKSGSYDVLEALGAKPALEKEKVEETFRKTGMAFMFAPLFHPALKYVMPVRRTLGLRTFFNLMGPVLNPANVRRQIVGAYSLEAAESIAEMFSQLDVEKALIFHSRDGLDEISNTAETDAFIVSKGDYQHIIVDAQIYGMQRVSIDSLRGGEAKENSEITLSILKGYAEKPKEDIALLNAGAAIWISGLSPSLESGIHKARESVKSGRALEKLNLFVEVTSKA